MTRRRKSATRQAFAMHRDMPPELKSALDAYALLMKTHNEILRTLPTSEHPTKMARLSDPQSLQCLQDRMVNLETAIHRMQRIVAINTVPNRPAEHDVFTATDLTADTGVTSSTIVSATNINIATAIAPAAHHGYLQITTTGDCAKSCEVLTPLPE
jgi:hypothetical protein